jgi:hypothetical protein
VYWEGTLNAHRVHSRRVSVGKGMVGFSSRKEEQEKSTRKIANRQNLSYTSKKERQKWFFYEKVHNTI